jgi:polyferredoxin
MVRWLTGGSYNAKSISRSLLDADVIMTTVERPTLGQAEAGGIRFDLLHLPWLGRLLRRRYGRLLFQIPLLLLLLLVIYDGFTGPQLAPANSATVLAWVHYRGLVIVGFLVLGNAFCMGCPFTLPRTLAHKLSLHGGRWPRRLRNKWIAIGGLLLIFWLYEWLDIWASPLLTAWLALAYLVLAFALEAFFTESPFCKYVCPLGAFNFTYAAISPFQIQTRSAQVCRTCQGKECVRGSKDTPGCGTELYVPMIQSNMDCTFCLDCARACPYDNVALGLRSPIKESAALRWPRRWSLSLMVICLAFMGLMNAFGMVPPVYALLDWLDVGLRLHSEALRLGLIFILGDFLIPAGLAYGAAWIGMHWTRSRPPDGLKDLTAQYAPAFIPVGFGIWLAHYGFHFAIGGLSILPVMQSFFLDHGYSWFGAQPNWELSTVIPIEWIFPLQVTAILGGFLISLYALARRALRPNREPLLGLREMIPWAIVVTVLVLLSLAVFNLPMEMRGTRMFGV